MLVWRVAHESAEYKGFPSGPYACGESLPVGTRDRLEDMHYAHCGSHHPSPFNGYSGLPGITEEQRCGFDSREALYEWFANFTAVLHECGFRVFVYDVPDFAAHVGNFGQTVFDKYEAIERSREDLDLTPAQIPLFA
ncbi:hypothetical protein [Streptomyces sp. NPDC059874]|uniref:hypothetical protein n=1 Tax=Streptomyces sp. NPDC059874 TaxID=3346983 RepID=UPI003662E721